MIVATVKANMYRPIFEDSEASRSAVALKSWRPKSVLSCSRCPGMERQGKLSCFTDRIAESLDLFGLGGNSLQKLPL